MSSKVMRAGLTLSVQDDSDDKAVDTQDTRHNNGNDRLEDEFGLEDTHAADTNATLCGAVGSAEVFIFNHRPFLLQKTRAAAMPM